MSCMEHKRLKLKTYCTNTRRNLIKIIVGDGTRETDALAMTTEEILEDMPREYIVDDDFVYMVYDVQDIDLNNDIAIAKQEDGYIDVEIKWYNGGAGRNEMIEEALNKKI